MKFVPLEETEQQAPSLTFVPLDEEKPAAKQEAKPAVPTKEIDPRTGKPYPEAVALPEKSLWEHFKDIASRNEVENLKARAANEAAARRAAAERGVPVSQIYKESGGYRPTFNPEGREGIQASVESTTAAAKSVKDILPSAANTYLRAVRGGDIPVKNKSWLDKAITSTKPEEKTVDKNVEAFANVGESIGYSAATYVASAVAGTLAGMATGPVGGTAAGMATSGALSYSATKDQFLERVKEKLDKDSVNLYGVPLDEKAWEKAKKEYDSLASEYGAWEAIPEAVSNALMLKAFTAPLKYVNSAEKLSKIALRGAAAQVPEHVSETITALGQNAAELKAGLTKEEMNVADAFRSQFVQSLITTGVMHGGSKTVEAANNFYTTYVEPKVRPGSALARAIQADIDATAFQASQPQRYTDAGKAAQPPQRQAAAAPVSQFPAPPTNLELEQTRNKGIETEPPTGLELEKTRKEGIETTPPAATPVDPLTELLKARNQGIETAPPAVTPKAEPIPDAEVEAKIKALTQDFMVKGFAEDDARMLAEQVVSENRAGRVLERDIAADEQRTVEGKAERALLQMGGNNVTAEPPAFVTQPSTDQYGNEVPSRQELSTEGISGPFDRGLDAGRRMVGELTGRDERERDSLEANKQRVQNQISQAFNREAYPDLGVLLGADWVRQTLSRNPTPEEYQEAAYARLEELNGERPEFSQPAKETPRVTEAPKAVQAKEERQEAPAAKPAAPAVNKTPLQTAWAELQETEKTLSQDPNATIADFDAAQAKYDAVEKAEFDKVKGIAHVNAQSAFDNIDSYDYGGDAQKAFDSYEDNAITTLHEEGIKDPVLFDYAFKEFKKEKERLLGTKEKEPAPLELEAARNEEIEVEPPEVKAVVKAESELPKPVKPRAPGGGRKKSEESKTREQRTKDTNAINQFNRDVLTLIGAAKKLQGPTGAFPTPAEYDYAEAARIRSLETLRKKIYELSLVRDPKAGYIAAKNYIRGLKENELERAKGLHEGTAEPHPLPVRPEATLTKHQLEQFRKKHYGVQETGTPSAAPKQAAPAKVEKKEAKETKPAEVGWKTESTEEPQPRITISEEEEEEMRKLRKEAMAPSKSLEQRIKDLGVKVEEEEETEEDEYGETQEDLHDVIEEELDEDDKALLADHYGRDSFDKKAKSEFIADIQLAMREGLEAVSSVLHEIIRRIQAGVLAAVIVMNPAYMSKPIPIAIPMYETKTVQVRAEVPAEAAAKMSEGAKTAYSVIYPAIKQKLKAKNKNFIITDKPTATLFVFDPNGKLVLDSKVLLGLQEGDYYKGNTEVPVNRITTAGAYTLALRDAARGVTDEGGDERRTAGHYDFGKVFVLDKAIDGKYSITLFHSVWTHEKDAKQRLAALEKPGAQDSRYSFGCINVAKPVYKYLLDTQQNRMDGATLFIVPENPANTMDFINGKAITAGDIVRQKIEPVTTEVKERVPTTPGEKKATDEAKAIAREEESGTLPAGIAFAGALAARRRKKGEQSNEDVIVDKIIDGTLNTAVAKKMNLSDLASLTAQAAQIVANEHSTEEDLTFANINNLSDALTYIQQAGTLLDAGIAAAIYSGGNKKIVDSVSLLTIDPDSKYSSQFAREMQTELKGANALYFPSDDFKKGYILLAHPKYGHNGTNALAVLHEGLHAITYAKIKYVQNMIDMGRESEVPARLMDAYKSLEELMNRAEAAYQKTSGEARLDELAAFDAFTDVNEFVSYGLTDSTMKAFLLQIPGTTTKTSGFSSFVNALMQLLGINPKEQTGFKDFVLATNELIQAKSPSPAKVEASNAERENLIKYAKAKKVTVAKAIDKLNAGKTAEEKLAALGSLSTVARNPSLWGDYIKLKWKYMNPEKLDIMLKASTTNRLYRLAKEIGVGENSIDDIQKGITEKNAFRMRTIHKVEDIVRGWAKLKGKESQRVSHLMHVSTMAQVDPSVNKSDPKLNAVWNSLTDKAKQVYIDARDFYTDHYNLYRGLLNQRIANANIAGPAKQMLMDEVRRLYETGAKLAPYFPIMRYGQYWATLGKGENKQFIMREAGQDRDFLIDEYVKEQNMKGDRRTRAEMIKAGDIRLGQNMETLQQEATQSSEILKKLFTMVDGITATDTTTKDEIKKDIFVMHLAAMPEGTFRKQFMPRQNTAGFSKDAMRNFIVMGNRFANQLSNMKYAPKIRNGISGARASIEKNPDKARMEMVVNRIAARAEEELNPPEMDTVGQKVARTATKGAFIWQMTSVKSGVAQMASLITHAMPVMWKHFGYGKTTAEMLRMARYGYAQVGITSKDAKGNLITTFPSIGSSKVVQGNKDYIKAFKALRESGVDEATRTMDLANRRKTASENYSPVISTLEAGMSFPFHFGERMSREITFMSAFVLSMDKFKNEPDHDKRVAKSIDLALEITKEGLFDYSEANTPELMRSVPARVVLQYRKFQAFNVEFLCRNFMEVFSNLPKEQRLGALKAFTGTLGLTGLIGGIRATFMYSMVMGAIQGMINLIRMAGDDDDELELWQTNFKKWFENVWLPEMFGEPKIGGVPLSELMLTGTIDNLTGYDISSGMSMDFWFNDDSPPSDWGNIVADTLVDWGGASVGWIDTLAKGVKDAQNGDWVKAFEKWTPAMFRGLLTDKRYTEEGARAGDLQIIKDADEFTKAQLVMQALGYKTKALAERQKDVFVYNNEKQKIMDQRSNIIKQIERSAELDRDERFQDMLDKAILFNSMYPNPDLIIESEDIEHAFERRMKMLEGNVRGITQEEKFEKLLDLQDRTERLLDAESE